MDVNDITLAYMCGGQNNAVSETGPLIFNKLYRFLRNKVEQFPNLTFYILLLEWLNQLQNLVKLRAKIEKLSKCCQKIAFKYK